MAYKWLALERIVNNIFLNKTILNYVWNRAMFFGNTFNFDFKSRINWPQIGIAINEYCKFVQFNVEYIKTIFFKFYFKIQLYAI